MSGELRAILRRNLPIGAALMALLLTSWFIAYQPIGPFKLLLIGLGIAATKALLVAVLFMGLRKAEPLVRLAACAGLLWVLFLFALTLSDVVARIAGQG